MRDGKCYSVTSSQFYACVFLKWEEDQKKIWTMGKKQKSCRKNNERKDLISLVKIYRM